MKWAIWGAKLEGRLSYVCGQTAVARNRLQKRNSLYRLLHVPDYAKLSKEFHAEVGSSQEVWKQDCREIVPRQGQAGWVNKHWSGGLVVGYEVGWQKLGIFASLL